MMIGGTLFGETPDLTPELEWILQTNQVSSKVIAEALVDEYYNKLLLLAEIILGGSDSAQKVAIETIFRSIQDRAAYRSDHGVSILVYTQAVKVLHQLNKKPILQSILSGQQPYLLPSFLRRTVKKEADPIANRFPCLSGLDFKARATLYFLIIERLNIEQIGIILKEKRSRTEKRLRVINSILKHDIKGIEHEETAVLILGDSCSARTLNLEAPAANLEPVVRKIMDMIYIKVLYTRRYDWMGKITVGAGVLIAVIGLFWLTNRSSSRETPLPLIPERVIITQIIRVPVYVTETPVPKTKSTPLNIASTSDQIKAALQQSATGWDRLWLDGITIQYGTSGDAGPPLIRRDQVWVSQPYDSLIITGLPKHGADQIWLSRNGKVFDVNPRTGDPILYDYHSDHLPVYSGFAEFIFPDPGIIASNTYQPVAEEKHAGRPALIVEEFNSTGAKTSQLWIDKVIGNVLRRIRFAADESTITQDRILLSIDYDVEIPNRIFNRNQLLTNFVGDHLGRFESSILHSLAGLDLVTMDALNGFVSAPPIFESADTELLFKWKNPQLTNQIKPQQDFVYLRDRNLKAES